MEFPIRINKYLAHKQIASRREVDALIDSGKILVNGQPASLGQKIHKDDVVEVLENDMKRQYLAYYKGRGIITHSPEKNEVDIASRLKKDYNLTDVYPVGRLDKDSEGLLLLTNDGRITGPLLDPAGNHQKVYEVTVDKPVTGQFLTHLERGVNIEGYITKPATAQKRTQYTFSLTLTEGKKHQIRRMCAALGYQVTSLKRVQILHISLGTLKPNQYRKLTAHEISKLLHTLQLPE